MKNEIEDILNRALTEAVILRLESPHEARSWRYRVHNHIRRHPGYESLMVTQSGSEIKIRRPRVVIVEE